MKVLLKANANTDIANKVIFLINESIIFPWLNALVFNNLRIFRPGIYKKHLFNVINNCKNWLVDFVQATLWTDLTKIKKCDCYYPIKLCGNNIRCSQYQLLLQICVFPWVGILNSQLPLHLSWNCIVLEMVWVTNNYPSIKPYLYLLSDNDILIIILFCKLFFRLT